jgi:hypothetical protein
MDDDDLAPTQLDYGVAADFSVAAADGTSVDAGAVADEVSAAPAVGEDEDVALIPEGDFEAAIAVQGCAYESSGMHGVYNLWQPS